MTERGVQPHRSGKDADRHQRREHLSPSESVIPGFASFCHLRKHFGFNLQISGIIDLARFNTERAAEAASPPLSMVPETAWPDRDAGWLPS